MKWIRYGFAILLIILALPFWRLQDWAVVTLPFPGLISAFVFVWSGVFIAFPLLLILPRMRGWMGLLLMALIGSISLLTGPFTDMATLEPTATHCGRLTYSGFFHPIRKVLSPAHQDDLEIRNQMCWLVKLIKKSPEEISEEELPQQLDLLKHKLLKPELKFRATLPWVMFLIGRYFSIAEESHTPVKRYKSSKLFVEQFNFYSALYVESVSARNYAWYEWPHSALINAEYGFIEENWDNIQLEF